MQQMTTLEALVVSHWYAVLGRALSDAAGLPGLSVEDVNALTDASKECANKSSNLATNLAQVAFQSASKAFQDVSDAASQAANTAKNLASDATKVNNLLQIAAKAVSLATAALTGDYGTALTDLIGLVGSPTAGQGASDPLAV